MQVNIKNGSISESYVSLLADLRYCFCCWVYENYAEMK